MGNWLQILIITLAIGGPALGKALEALNKKRQEREKKKAEEDARRESLRTGQPLPPQISIPTQAPPAPARAPTPTAHQRMQEMARKRQQQIEELRRRQQAARQQAQQRQTPRPTTPPTRSQPTASAPRTRPATQPQARSQPRAQGMPPPVRPAPRPPRVVPQTNESDTPATSIHTLELDPHVAHPSTEAAVAPVTIMGKTMDAKDWRRFIVARELLDPPLALRRPDA